MVLHYVYDNTPYVFNPLTIQTLAVAVALVLLGIYGVLREQGSRVSVVFFVLTLSMGVWLFAFAWMYCSLDARLALRWARVGYAGIACIPAAVYHFSTLILMDYEKVRKRVLALWMLSACFIALILTTDMVLPSLERHWWGYYPKLGIANIPFVLYFFSIVVITLRRFAAEYGKALKGTLMRMRARTLLIAMTTGYLASIDFIASFGVPWYPVGPLAIFIFLILAARAISTYRFMAITPAFAARQIIDTMNDALIVLDPDGVVRVVNPATCELFNCNAQDLVGKRPTEGCMAKNIAFAERLESTSRSSTVRNSEILYEPPGGSRRILNLSVTTMRNPAGEPLARVCVAGDMTDRKRAEEERELLIAQLREANLKLQAMDKMKSDFISMVSHELRTPLTTIKAFVELIIMKPGMPDHQKEKLMGTINGETDRLARLVTDLLDLARIESGSMKWRVDTLSLEDLIREVIAGMGLFFENKRLQVTMTVDSPLPAISGDRDRLVQVVTNILSNAVKFTPAGGMIRINLRHESDPVPQVVVEVSDTGMGIPARDLELIFERFQRSSDELNATIEGTGLGLAIARQIVEYHGGRIWATSTQGKGSIFTFTIPLTGRTNPGAPVGSNPALS